MLDGEREFEAAADEVSADAWMTRATLFELLSLGLLKPERAVAEALTSGEFAAACAETLVTLGLKDAAAVTAELLAGYEDADAEGAYHEILREYTRLFVGEREPLVTPFAGVRAAQAKGQQGLLFVGKESMDVERFMRRAGVAKNLAAGQSNDPVDHIGTMCEFCKFLCLVNARAVAPAEGAVVEAGDFDRFMADHFVPYATWCAVQLRELSRIPFYGAMAVMLDAAVSLSAA